MRGAPVRDVMMSCYHCHHIRLQSVLATILVVGLFSEKGISQCFTDTSCTRDTVPASTERECCVETNEGLAFLDGGTCTPCIVHGFARAFYEVIEEDKLETIFGLNVKGDTSLPLMISGVITLEAGTASKSDFDEMQPIEFENRAEICLFTSNDVITLEYNDTVILSFTPDSPLLIPGIEGAGEYVRGTAIVYIIDNDRLEINFEESDYSIIEGTPLSVQMQFRPTESPFTLTVRPISVANAEDSLEGFTNCAATIEEASRATPGTDFIDTTFSFKVEGASTGTGVLLITLENITIDDDVNEIQQTFVLVAEIGYDVPNSFTCFQIQVGDADCLRSRRTGTTEIRIIDNDQMIIGFDQRYSNVLENAGGTTDLSSISISVSSMRTSERDYKIVFRYQQSSNTAIVETFTNQSNPLYDALFGIRRDNGLAGAPIVVTQILRLGNIMIPSVMTKVRNDIRPEDRECYTISIMTIDIEGVRESFTCNEDDSNSTKFFCDHTICIFDDDEPFRIAFVETMYTITESEGQVEVCVNLTYPPVNILNEIVRMESYNYESSIYIPPNALLATPDLPNFLGIYPMAARTDYEEQLYGINRIRNTVINETRRLICYNQTVYDDVRLELSEYAGLALAVSVGSLHTKVEPMYDQLAIHILDDDTSLVGLDRTLYNVSEQMGMVEVCAIIYSPVIDCPIAFPFDVRLSSTNGSAVSPVDYDPVSTILAFGACDTRQCYQIHIVDDMMVELTESFFITLERTSDLNSRITLNPVDGRVEITDTDEAVVGLETTLYTVLENVGVVEVCTIVYSPSVFCPISYPFEVTFSTDDGTAEDSTDYGFVSAILNFAACEIRSCVDISIMNDIENELDEALNITLERSPDLNGRITLDPVGGVITVFNDGFCYSLPNCVEGSEIETQTGTQIDCCIGTDDGQSYADSGGNCVVPQCIVHGFASATYNVIEGQRLDTTFGLNIKGITPSPLLHIFGTITSERGSARSTDFINLQPIRCETSADVHLFTNNDDITLEYNDTVILRFIPDSPLLIPGIEGTGEYIRDTAIVYIIDTDRLLIDIEEADYSIREGDTSDPYIRLGFRRTQTPFTITLLPVSIVNFSERFHFTLDNFITIPTNSDAIATADADFTTVPFNITIPATQDNPPGPIFEDIPYIFNVIDDDVNEEEETFALVAELGDDVPDSFACFQKQVWDTVCLGRTGATQIKIVDNDEPLVVAYVQTTYTVTESEGQVEVCVNLTHSEIDLLGETVRVEVFNDRTYIPPNAILATPDYPNFLGIYSMAPMTDYEEQIRSINRIRNKVISATSSVICYNQPIYDDMRLEVSEYAGLTLVVRDATIRTRVEAMYDQSCIKILDDDEAEVGLERTFYQVSEDEGVVKVCAVINSPNITCPISFAFDVRLSTSDNISRMEKVSPDDYGSVSTVLAFSACDTQQCIEIQIQDDIIVELTEPFSVTLERTPGLDSRIILDPVHSKIDITDNDEAVVGLERTSYTVLENFGVLEVCTIVYSPMFRCPISHPFEVTLSTDGDIPIDYGAVSTNLSFAACENQTCVDIPIVNNKHYELDEAFHVILERIIGLNDRITLDPVDAVFIIKDDDGILNQCYSQPNCTEGSEIETPTKNPTPSDCCSRTNDGQSYADSGGNCVIPQCVVHGFDSAVYSVVEGERLDTVFNINVKGTTALPLVVLGTITSDKGSAKSTDFEILPPIHFETSADIHLSTSNDDLTLEYEDTIILTFTPDNPILIRGIEDAGEYIRDTATVYIIDNDVLEINFEEDDYSIIEGSPLNVLMQFRRTQSPFTLSVKPVSITSAETSGLFNCTTIREDSRATPGDDFTDMMFTFKVEGESTELGVHLIRLENVTINDEINEIEQKFALVVEIGDDVPSNFTCFQRQVSDSGCQSRTGAREVRIIDDDRMIIGFDQRYQNVSENAGGLMDLFPLFVTVSTLRTSERSHTIVFRYQESSNTAIVETFTIQNNPLYDALFGNRTDNVPLGDPIQVIEILNPGIDVIPSLMTKIRNDFRPEDQECYTISIMTPDIEGVRESFTCNEDDSNSTEFFCDHTICIMDDDEPFIVAFVETTYTVMESKGQVEVCVNLTHTPVDVFNETVRVELYNNNGSIYIPPNAVLATPDSPNFLGLYSMSTKTDFEEQIIGINRIRNTFINEMRRTICYNQIIYDDTHLEVSEYAGLTLTVRDATVHTDVQPMYDQVAIHILDDDRAVVGLESTSYSVLEEMGTVEVCAIIYSPVIDCPIAFPFDIGLTTNNGSAVYPMDYDPVSVILAFSACDTRQCIEILVENDMITEMTESFFITLERTSGLNRRITLDPVETEIEITNNDGSLGLGGGTVAAISIVVVLMLCLVVLVGIVVTRTKKKNRSRRPAKNGVEDHTDDKDTEYETEQLKAMESEKGGNAREPNVVQKLKMELIHKKMIFSKNCIHLCKVVGQGQSGLVYCGYLDRGHGRDMVAIKTCKALSLGSDKKKLVNEVTTMLSFTHPNVMSIIGACFDEEVPLIIMPYMSNGSMLGYVKQNREELLFDSQANQDVVATARKLCLGMCHQISKGMEYLVKHKCVHRDLAARNCMIDRLGVIKVADFGMSEDMYVRNYFRRDKSERGSEEKVPIRWMAPESIEDEIYNEKTDVWSFGVTCWEVFTCGGVPYGGVPAMTLLSQLRNCHRLTRPCNATCSNEIWNMMLACWDEHPRHRPDFTGLVEVLSNLLESDSTYLKLS